VVGINGKDSEGMIVLSVPNKSFLWHSLCPATWDDKDADVACKTLGFIGGASVSYR
jgi:hypothetical protein